MINNRIQCSAKESKFTAKKIFFEWGVNHAKNRDRFLYHKRVSSDNDSSWKCIHHIRVLVS